MKMASTVSVFTLGLIALFAVNQSETVIIENATQTIDGKTVSGRAYCSCGVY